jgi:hypothetical protein
MLVIVRQVQKPGLSPEECQDAVAVDRSRRRFAVADGVSDGVYPGQWARIVANGCLALPRLGPAELSAVLPSWQNAWMQSLPDGHIPWYVQAKLKATGAFSTLASLEIEPYRENRRLWRVFTIGDSCVFQIRKGRLIKAHPFTRENQFSNRVLALPSAESCRSVRPHGSGPIGSGRGRTAGISRTMTRLCWKYGLSESAQPECNK